MEQALADYLRHLELEKNASAYTVKSYREDLTQAVQFFQNDSHLRRSSLARFPRAWFPAFLAWLHETGLFSRRPLPAASPQHRSWFSILAVRRNAYVESRSWFTRPAPIQEAAQALTQGEFDRLLAAPEAATDWPARQGNP